jgi:hypothetical protein
MKPRAYILTILLTIIFAVEILKAQDLSVISVNDGAFPEILVRAKVLISNDSITISELNKPVQSQTEDAGASSSGNEGRMYVFLVENSYYFHHNKTFPAIKKAMEDIGDYLHPNDNANILYFGHPESNVMYVSAEQSSDFPLLKSVTQQHFTPQCDSIYIDNNLISAILEAMAYCRRHKQNHQTTVLTIISRGLNLSDVREFPDDFGDNIIESGIYLNALIYKSESQNIKRIIQQFTQDTDGSFCEFTEQNLEQMLVQSLEKMSKAKDRSSYKEVLITFQASQTGASNSFVIKYGNSIARCEYTNPNVNGIMGKHPQVILLAIGLILAATTTGLYFKYRNNIIKKIDSSAQEHVEDIKRQNRKLKQEIEKYKRHPLNLALKFNNADVEEALIGSGKIIPKLIVDDRNHQHVYNLTKVTMTIGRNESNDIVIDNRTVSGHHATITNEGGIFYISDDNSTNGIFINDIRITKSKVQPDDRIRIGAVIATLIF